MYKSLLNRILPFVNVRVLANLIVEYTLTGDGVVDDDYWDFTYSKVGDQQQQV